MLYLNLKQYENALEQFIKCLCIFKYIIYSNSNWASGPKEQNEINQMIKTALLNISLVYLILKDYSKIRKACDEVLKLESKNMKALYRKAKSYIDNPESLLDDYIQAKKLIELAHKKKTE